MNEFMCERAFSQKKTLHSIQWRFICSFVFTKFNINSALNDNREQTKKLKLYPRTTFQINQKFLFKWKVNLLLAHKMA